MATQPKEIKPQPTEVFLSADEGEESPNLVLESPSGSGKGKRTTEGYKLEILDWLDAFNAENGRGGLSAASKKFKVSMLTLGNWRKKLRPKDGEGEATPRKPRSSSSTDGTKIEMNKIYSVLGGKGFKFSTISTWGPEGITTEFKGDPKIAVLNLQAHDGSIDDVESQITSVVSTKNKIVVAMPLEFLLELMKIKA